MAAKKGMKNGSKKEEPFYVLDDSELNKPIYEKGMGKSAKGKSTKGKK